MVTNKQWNKLSEEQKEILGEIGITSVQDIKNAVWKRLEKATPFDRHIFINLKNPKEIDLFYQTLYVLGINTKEDWENALSNPKKRDIHKLPNETKNKFTRFFNGEYFKIKYDKKWRNLYSSFRHSKEWKDFKNGYLIRNPNCNRCNNLAEIPHHKISMINIAIQQGFLKCLKEDKNFESLCEECHIEEEGI